MRRLILPSLLVAMTAGSAFAQGFASDALPGRVAVEPILSAAWADEGGEIADLVATWNDPPQWLEGVAFSGSAFGGGAYYGHGWFARSSISPAEDLPVEIVFDRFETTNARIWRRDQGYEDGGVGRFPGAAYDISDPNHPRRLNITFVEDATTCGGADGVWSPSGDALGCREYLYIMASDYDGDGSTYAGQIGFDLDLLYALAARIPDDRALYETNPASLTLSFPPLRFFAANSTANGAADVSASYNPNALDALPAGARVTFLATPDGGSTQEGDTTYLATPGGFTASAVINGLDPSQFYSFQASLRAADGATIYTTPELRLRPAVQVNASLIGNWNERYDWADVWGYVAPTGREYALVALRGLGMSIVDISGSTPAEVGFIPTQDGASDSKDVKVIGEHAYLVNETGPIQIVSLADPTNPQQVGLLDVQPGVSHGGAHNVSVDDAYLYVTGGSTTGNAGLRIYSVADPTSPTLVSEFRPDHFRIPYYHDFYVDGDIGYGPGIYSGSGIDILDLSDRGAPLLVGTFDYPGSGAHNVCGTADGRHIYVGDEIGSAGNWTRIFDVSDPLNVEYEGDIIVDENAVVHNCYVANGLLHIGHYTEGYRVFDISDPLAPVEVALYDTYLEPLYGTRGVWSIYPFFPSGRIAVSDRSSGLFVVELDDSVTTTQPPVLPGEMDVTVGPNPATGRLTVRATLPASASVTLSVLDALGREVQTVYSGETSGTFHETIEAGTLATGTYILRLDVDGEVTTRTITVVR